MTMYTLPNFCRVCLKYDKNLIDLAHIENEPSETLMSKLQQCVSEVEWSVYKPLLCHPCIKRLNIAYGFKKQCVQSAGVMKSYIELVKDSQKKNESPSSTKETPPGGGAYMLLPNQKYVKILVGSQNSGSQFQNVFLNVIPANVLNSSDKANTPQAITLNLNNALQKFVPIAPSDKNHVNVNELLTESNTEEVSVEIDPLDITGLVEEEEESNETEEKDWDEVISQSKITSKGEAKTVNGVNGKPTVSYVPIMPSKHKDFSNSGQHFLFADLGDFSCEICQKSFPNIDQLRQHFKHFHLGKLPFKCERCHSEFLLRSDYEACVKRHLKKIKKTSSLTLEDFANSSQMEINNTQIECLGETGDFTCDICKSYFNSSSGLMRHKVRKHNHKNRKKYFIKGMKNAKCDICNREFSTQSYLQLHRKLHLRDNVGYKYKVFHKKKYKEGEKGTEENSQEQKSEESQDEKPQIESEKSEGEKEVEESVEEKEVQEEKEVKEEKPEETKKERLRQKIKKQWKAVIKTDSEGD